MTAAELRALTVGSVLACSPVRFRTPDGREFEYLRSRVGCCSVCTDPETGQQKPGEVPVLTLFVREVTAGGAAVQIQPNETPTGVTP